MEDRILINYKSHDEDCVVPLDEYCMYLSKRNQVVLHKLEEYLGKSLKDDKNLKEIRSLILSVSGDIQRLADNITLEVE